MERDVWGEGMSDLLATFNPIQPIQRDKNDYVIVAIPEIDVIRAKYGPAEAIYNAYEHYFNQGYSQISDLMRCSKNPSCYKVLLCRPKVVVETVDTEIVEDQPNDQAKNTMETIL